MAVIVLIGDFGVGKTTFIKNYLTKTKNEKYLYALVKNDYNLLIERNFKNFMYNAVQKKDSFFVIDEARTALPKKIPDNPNEHIMRVLTFFINARKLNNVVFIVYHSLSEFPLWLISYTDIMVRFRTNDLLQYQISRFRSFPAILKSLEDYPSMENFECDEIKTR